MVDDVMFAQVQLQRAFCEETELAFNSSVTQVSIYHSLMLADINVITSYMFNVASSSCHFPLSAVSLLLHCPVNTASRMESNGLPMQIHVTEETVNLLRDRNKGHWVTARSDKVWAKGKGEMQTYWLTSHSDAHRSRSSGSHESSTYIDMFLSDSPQRKPRNVLRLEAGMASVAAPAVSKLSPPSSPANWRSEAETLNALEAELARRYIRGGGGGGSSSSDGVMPAERAHL
jgi:hypothetical protein